MTASQDLQVKLMLEFLSQSLQNPSSTFEDITHRWALITKLNDDVEEELPSLQDKKEEIGDSADDISGWKKVCLLEVEVFWKKKHDAASTAGTEKALEEPEEIQKAMETLSESLKALEASFDDEDNDNEYSVRLLQTWISLLVGRARRIGRYEKIKNADVAPVSCELSPEKKKRRTKDPSSLPSSSKSQAEQAMKQAESHTASSEEDPGEEKDDVFVAASSVSGLPDHVPLIDMRKGLRKNVPTVAKIISLSDKVVPIQTKP